MWALIGEPCRALSSAESSGREDQTAAAFDEVRLVEVGVDDDRRISKRGETGGDFVRGFLRFVERRGFDLVRKDGCGEREGGGEGEEGFHG